MKKPVSHILFFILLLGTLASACKKEPSPPPSSNPNSGPTQYGTPFNNLPATEDVVMYEVNLRAFSSGGDLSGVINRLDEIKALGVNVIWLMPVHPMGEINSVGSPYSVQNYLEVGDEYGDLADLRTLTNEAHARDMAVIMDWVANHTAWDNPWIENKEWYTQDGNGNIIHPAGTNWQDVADLNFNNAAMRLTMIEAMTYWVLEANIDGFRCDAADFVPFEFWEQALDSLNGIPNRELILLAEGDRADHFDAGFQMNFSWHFYGQLKNVFNGQSATSLLSVHNSEYQNVPTGKHKLRFTTNHDESAWDATPVDLFNGIDGAFAASLISTTLGGVPLIYGSQEVGHPNPIPFFYNSTINWNSNPQLLQDYQDLMSFYNLAEPLRKGDLQDHSGQDVVCFQRTWEGDRVWVIVNCRNTTTNFSLPSEIQNSTWVNAFSGGMESLGTSLSLSAYDYRVLRN